MNKRNPDCFWDASPTTFNTKVYEVKNMADIKIASIYHWGLSGNWKFNDKLKNDLLYNQTAKLHIVFPAIPTIS